MQSLKDFWPLLLFAIGMISTSAVAIFRVNEMGKHMGEHCLEIKRLREDLNKHAADEDQHFNKYDRQAAEEYRTDVRQQLDKIEEKIMYLTRMVRTGNG